MSTSTISTSATQAVGFVAVTCFELDGDLRYDIVLHEDEMHSGNARNLSLSEALDYLSLLFAEPAYASFAREVSTVLGRLTAKCMGGGFTK